MNKKLDLSKIKKALSDFFLKIFAKKKATPVDTALIRERMQPHTIEKLESVGRELKEEHPAFLGNGHITVLGPVSCFIPLSVLMVALYGPIMLLLLIVPAVCVPLFIYLRKKGTEELYGRSDFDLGLFHYKSCKSYKGHGKYIFETVLKATVPYMVFVLVISLLFLGWGGRFARVDTSNAYTIKRQFESISVEDDYIAIRLLDDEKYVFDDSIDYGEGQQPIIKKTIDAEYRISKFTEYFDLDSFNNVKAGDEVVLNVNRQSIGSMIYEDKNLTIEVIELFGISSGGVEYFGEEQIKMGEKKNNRTLIISASAYIVYAAAASAAIYFANKYAKDNFENETVDLSEVIDI